MALDPSEFDDEELEDIEWMSRLTRSTNPDEMREGPARRDLLLRPLTPEAVFAEGLPPTIIQTLAHSGMGRRGNASAIIDRITRGAPTSLLFPFPQLQPHRWKKFTYGEEWVLEPRERPEGVDAVTGRRIPKHEGFPNEVWLPGGRTYRPPVQRIRRPLTLPTTKRAIKAFLDSDPVRAPFNPVQGRAGSYGWAYDGNYEVFNDPAYFREHQLRLSPEPVRIERYPNRRLQRFATPRWYFFIAYAREIAQYSAADRARLTDAQKLSIKMKAMEEASKPYYDHRYYLENLKRDFFEFSDRIDERKKHYQAELKRRITFDNQRLYGHFSRIDDNAIEAFTVPWPPSVWYGYLRKINSLAANTPNMRGTPDYPYPKKIYFRPNLNAAQLAEVAQGKAVHIPTYTWDGVNELPVEDADMDFTGHVDPATGEMENFYEIQCLLVVMLESMAGCILKLVIDEKRRQIVFGRCVTDAMTIEELADFGRMVEEYIWARRYRGLLWTGTIRSSVVGQLFDNTKLGPVSQWPVEFLAWLPKLEVHGNQMCFVIKRAVNGRKYLRANELRDYMLNTWLSEPDHDFEYDYDVGLGSNQYFLDDQKDPYGIQRGVEPTATAMGIVSDGEVSSFFDGLSMLVKSIKNNVHGGSQNWEATEKAAVDLKIISISSLALRRKDAPECPGGVEYVFHLTEDTDEAGNFLCVHRERLAHCDTKRYIPNGKFRACFNDPRFDVVFRDRAFGFDPNHVFNVISMGRHWYFNSQVMKLVRSPSNADHRAYLEKKFTTDLLVFTGWQTRNGRFVRDEDGNKIPIYEVARDPLTGETIKVANVWEFFLGQPGFKDDIHNAQSWDGPAQDHLVDGLRYKCRMTLAKRDGTYIRETLYRALEGFPWVEPEFGHDTALSLAVKNLFQMADVERQQWAAYQAIGREWGWGNFNWSDKDSADDLGKGFGTIWTTPEQGEQLMFTHFLLGRYVDAAHIAKNWREYTSVFKSEGFQKEDIEKFKDEVRSGKLNWQQALFTMSFFKADEIFPAEIYQDWHPPKTDDILRDMEETIRRLVLHDGDYRTMFDKKIPWIVTTNPNYSRAYDLIADAVEGKGKLHPPLLMGTGPFKPRDRTLFVMENGRVVERKV